MGIRNKKTSIFEKLLMFSGACGVVILVWVLLFAGVDRAVMPLYTMHNHEGRIPEVIGLDYQGALTLAEQCGFDIHNNIARKADSNHETGTVIEQLPPAGSLCKKGRKIKITVSSGAELVVVPEVVGLSEKEALMRLKTAGLRINEDSTRYLYSDYYPEGVAAAQNVQPGLKLDRGSEVYVTISMGNIPSRHTIPDVRNRTLSEAKRAIFKAGMKIGLIEYFEYPRSEMGSVIWQNPLPGNTAEPGTEIHIRVNQAKVSETTAAADSAETPSESPQE